MTVGSKQLHELLEEVNSAAFIPELGTLEKPPPVELSIKEDMYEDKFRKHSK